MDNLYVFTWIQYGVCKTFIPQNQLTEDVVQLWVEVCLNFMQDECIDNCLFKGSRCVARQATYQGIEQDKRLENFYASGI